MILLGAGYFAVSMRIFDNMVLFYGFIGIIPGLRIFFCYSKPGGKLVSRSKFLTSLQEVSGEAGKASGSQAVSRGGDFGGGGASGNW